MKLMTPKGFLQVGGAALVLLGILGFAGVIGPGPQDSIFGASWWFDNAENWAHLVLGVVALFVSVGLGGGSQRTLVKLLGVLGVAIGVYSIFNTQLLNANLENPADTSLHIIVGLWALRASKGSA